MRNKVLLLVVLVLSVIAFFAFGLEEWISIAHFQGQFDARPLLSVLLFFVLYVVCTALNIPFATALTLLAGAVFGIWWGTLIVSFASTVGASLAMLLSRFLLRDWVEGKFSQQLNKLNNGIERDGNSYLFSLRLIPVVPFFVINMTAGLTSMRLVSFYWVSQLGMLPATILYVNAGVQLAAVDELSVTGVFTPSLIVSFVLLAVFPFVAKKIMRLLRDARRLRSWRKPKNFDANLIVIGAGAAGLVSAYIAAAVKAKVILVEKAKMGGDCLNTGCVPSKALIHAASSLHLARKAEKFSKNSVELQTDFVKVMEHVRSAIKKIEPHDSIERYTKLGVRCVTGNAKIISPWEVEVDGRTLASRSIIIASGAQPFIPSIPGIEKMNVLTSENLWHLTVLPKRLLILGGGPIGCELAQAFRRLGSEVTVLEKGSRVLSRADADVSKFILQTLASEGIKFYLNASVESFSRENEINSVTIKNEVEEVETLVFDNVVVAVGRRANTEDLCENRLGLENDATGRLVCDENLRCSVPTIFACGDVVGPYQFTHVASHEAWYASVNALFGKFKLFSVDYRVIPWAVFTDPEIAHVGLTEHSAQEKAIAYEVTRYELKELDRAITEDDTQGFVKVLTVPGKDKILGATLVGARASDMVTEFVNAMKNNKGLNAILGTIHLYPGWSEANKSVAGNWKLNHAPERLLRWLARYHRWRLH